MNTTERDELLAQIANLGERAREAEHAVSLLAGEVDAMRRKVVRETKA